VWAYIKCDVPFLHTARRLANGNTLMSASGGDRVVEVNRDGDTVWTMASGLDYPDEAQRLANGNTLITDRDNNRVIEVTPDRAIAWSYTGLAHPHNGNRLANGNTLVCDSDRDQVVEVDALGTVVWHYGIGLRWPRCAERLGNGNTLIADSQNNRVIEVDSSGRVVWSVNNVLMPYAAARLDNGNTLVSAGMQVIEVTPADSIVWQYPKTVAVVVETLRVVNPSSGCPQYVHIHRPVNAGPDNPVPGVVFVPGGNEFGSSFDSTGLPDGIASDGFAFLHFDPDSRGLSGQFPYPETSTGTCNRTGCTPACRCSRAVRTWIRAGWASTPRGTASRWVRV
jgi:hypothetical protein